MSVSTIPELAPPDRLRRPEAAEFLGVSTATMADWACSGRGPRYLKYGSARCSPVVYLVADLIKFQNKCAVVPACDEIVLHAR